IPSRVIDFHPCLIEVLDEARAAGVAGIWLALRAAGCGSPIPASLDLAGQHRPVQAFPGSPESRVGEALCLRRRRRHCTLADIGTDSNKNGKEQNEGYDA